MAIKWQRIQEAMREAEGVTRALKAKRAEFMSYGHFTGEHKQKLIDAEINSARARIGDIFASVREDIAHEVDTTTKKAAHKAPENPSDRAAYYAEKTYLATVAGNLLAGMDGAGAVKRLAVMTAEGHPSGLVREAIALAEGRIERRTSDGMTQARTLARIKTTSMTPDEAKAAALTAAAQAFTERLRMLEARATNNVQSALAGHTEMPLAMELGNFQQQAEDAALDNLFGSPEERRVALSENGAPLELADRMTQVRGYVSGTGA